MRKQLQIGFAVVVILLILESARAFAGTLDQIEIRIVTEDRSVEVVDTVRSSPGGVSMQPQSPTNTLQAVKEQISPAKSSPAKSSPVPAQPTSTGERPEVLASSTSPATFTAIPTEKLVWKKYTPPSTGGSKEGSSGAPAPTGIQKPMPTSAPTSEPLPTSAPPSPSDQAPTGANDALPTAAPPPEGL